MSASSVSGTAIRSRVKRREILRESLAQPLLVIVLPADSLAPPLVRDLVREKEQRIDVVERDRIVRPGIRRRRQRLVKNREERGTVSAG